MLDTLYPKDTRDNLKWRIEKRELFLTSQEAREVYYACCARDIIFWINTSCWTLDPRKTPANLPFITYKFQDELILDLQKHIREQKDILFDKSRDMGLTWCVLLVFQHFWQFGESGNDFLLGSRKEGYVDKTGDMDALFPKLDYSIRNQPKFLLPKGFDIDKHRNYMNIINPHTGSTIAGEATNESFGRGGRRRAVLFDEFAFWENSQSAWRSAADTTKCRVAVSTPCGLNNQFAKLRFSETIDVHSVHWKLHPEKTDEWYKSECERRNNDKVEIGQELDISYETSEDGILFDWNDLRRARTAELNASPERMVVSCDPSTEGDDEAIIYVGNDCVLEKRTYQKAEAMQLAGEIVALARKWKAQVIIVDAIGSDVVSCISSLIAEGEKFNVIAFKGSDKAENPIKYYNKRAECYHFLSERLKSGNIRLPDDYKLHQQLNATRYKKKDGRIILIPKEDIKAQLRQSPDRGDAFSMMIYGSRFTWSQTEIKTREDFRQPFTFDMEEVPMGSEYGDW